MLDDEMPVATLPDVPSEGAGPALSGKGRTAILVAHGMGQQLPYETLEMVVDGLETSGGYWEVTDRALGIVRVGETDLRRVELTLGAPTPTGWQERKVDVYEAYWAPLTEGKVGLLDVFSFLAGAAVSGLKRGAGARKRWLFGAWRLFPPVRGVTFALSIGLLTLVALAVMNVIAFAALGLVDVPDVQIPDANLQQVADELTAALLVFLLLAGLLGAWMAVSASASRRARSTGVAAGLGRLTDAGMSMFGWALAAAIAFLVAAGALAAAYAPCIRAAECDPDAGDRTLALLGVAGAATAAILAPRFTGIILAWGGAALVAASLVALHVPGVHPLVPLGLAGAGLVHGLWRAGKEVFAPGATAGRWYHAAFFASAIVGTLLLVALLVYAPVVPGLDDARPMLLVAAVLATLSALVGMGVGAFFTPPPRASPGTLGWTLLALAASAIVLVLLLGLWALPPGARSLAAWGLVAGIAVVVGRLLKQYVGDVAAYVSAHKLDRFAQLRVDIDAAVKRVADAVYGMRTPDGKALMYDRVILVSHSLGSVVTYNALNALLLDDQHAAVAAQPGPEACDHPRRVAERTRLLVTFGSPLDRTAFIFATRREDESAGLAMASFEQPLLADAAAREGIKWVNVHSRADIISSELTYYDVPDGTGGGRVQNYEDVAATVPLAAHVQYWKNPEVWYHVVRTLYAP